MKLIITQHTRDKMHIEGIDKEQVITAIRRGAKTRQTDGFLIVYTYIRVAYKIIGKDTYLIKTVIIE